MKSVALLLLAGIVGLDSMHQTYAQIAPEQQSAIRSNCRSDFLLNCVGVMPGGPEALRCLQRNVNKLSQSCQAAVKAVTPQSAAAPRLTGVPVQILVADFDLDPEAFRPDSIPQVRPGVIDRLVRGDSASQNPAERARALIDMMGRMLAQNLTAAGLNARRLAPSEAAPKQGWLVRGRFTAVDEGNRVVRSMIGFGEGKANLTVAVVVDDLNLGISQPLGADGAQSGKMPGSAVTAAIRFNPFSMAAKFALSGFDTERNVMKTAGEISNNIVALAR